MKSKIKYIARVAVLAFIGFTIGRCVAIKLNDIFLPVNCQIGVPQ